MFLSSLSFSDLNQRQQSLNQHTSDIYFDHNLLVSKQGLDQRFNTTSIAFIKSILEDYLRNKSFNTLNTKAFAHFNSVRIKDSTSFGLPENMKSILPGNGGGNITEAVGRIQFEFDVKTGKVIELRVAPGKINDFKNCSTTLSNIRKNDLLIRDLGYVSIDYMEYINNVGAYFINRLKLDTKIYYRKSGKFIDLSLKQLRNDLSKSNKLYIEKEVYIGRNRYMPVRLIIHKVPEDKLTERINRHKRKTKRRCSDIKQDYLDNASMNLFITNLPKNIMRTDKIYDLYKFRWHIEIIFKVWKSIGEIHLYKKVKPERLITMLYAKLLALMLCWEIIKPILLAPINKSRQLISIYKCFKILSSIKHSIKGIILSTKKSGNILYKIYEIFFLKGLMEQRKHRTSYADILEMHSSK